MYTANATRDTQQYLTQYAPLVKRIAHHMMAKLPASVEMDDVIQTGMLGLLDAVNRYEESHGAQFETYAAQRIRGAILDGLRQVDWLPRSFRRDLRRIERAIAKLEQRLGHAPNEQEVASELGLPLADYQKMLQEARGYQLVSFEDFDHSERESPRSASGFQTARADRSATPPRPLVVCRSNGGRVSPSHRRQLARTHNEGASTRCVEAEDAARGVEGRRDAVITWATDH